MNKSIITATATAMLSAFDFSTIPGNLWVQIPAFIAVIIIMLWMLKKQDRMDEAMRKQLEGQRKDFKETLENLQKSFDAAVSKVTASNVEVASKTQATFQEVLDVHAQGFVCQMADQQKMFLTQYQAQRHDHRREINSLLLMLANATDSPANQKLAAAIREQQMEIAAEEARLRPVPTV